MSTKGSNLTGFVIPERETLDKTPVVTIRSPKVFGGVTCNHLFFQVPLYN